jgi:hypothetical protein
VLAVLVAIAAAVVAVRAFQPSISVPIAVVHAHAHNDYAHPRPLQDALDHGFCSVEVDIWLVNGGLLVAHDRDAVQSDRTIEALYLDPLRERVRRNGGRVYPRGPECTLLIDVKSEAASTYDVLAGVLERYADILTTFRGGTVEHRAILAIVSGNSAPWLMANEPVRYAALDGGLADLSSSASPELVPWISVDWRKLFTWSGGRDVMPDREQRLLDQVVADAHRQGRKVRFWDAPDTAGGWQVLWDAHVDLINTDDLAGVERFLREREWIRVLLPSLTGAP